MAIRCGYTVGRTTAESSLNDQLRIFQPRKIKKKKKKKKNVGFSEEVHYLDILHFLINSYISTFSVYKTQRE